MDDYIIEVMTQVEEIKKEGYTIEQAIEIIKAADLRGMRFLLDSVIYAGNSGGFLNVQDVTKFR